MSIVQKGGIRIENILCSPAAAHSQDSQENFPLIKKAPSHIGMISHL
jgi:hypothetical protein